MHALADLLRRLIPDPFTIALGLTLVAFVAAWVSGVALGDATTAALVEGWVNGAPLADGGPSLGGLWSLLGFSMQMCLILVTGFVVASTGPVQAVVRRLSALPQSTAQAAVLVSLVAMGCALVHWGLGLIVGALLAKEVALALRDRGVAVHYPLLAAAGYTGLTVWHGGLSGSAPLKVTSADQLASVLGPLADRVDPMTLPQTIGSPRNLLATGAVLVVVPLVLAWLVPPDEAAFEAPPDREDPPDTASEPAATLGGRLVLYGVVLLGLAWVLAWAVGGGLATLNPNHMNLIFLLIGLALVGDPRRYMALAGEAARACAGILVQFPLYGGILGLLAAGGLVERLAELLPRTEAALAVVTFLSAGVLNVLVPSGGGQWALQGPLVMQAAAEAGADPARIVLALSWGDQWTNLFQPFWALPLLGLTGTRAGDILGYTAIVGLAVGLVFALGAALG